MKDFDALTEIFNTVPGSTTFHFKQYSNEIVTHEGKGVSADEVLEWVANGFHAGENFLVFKEMENGVAELFIQTGYCRIIFPKQTRPSQYSAAYGTFIYTDVYETIEKSKLFQYLSMSMENYSRFAISTYTNKPEIRGWDVQQFFEPSEVILTIRCYLLCRDEIRVFGERNDGARQLLFTIVGFDIRFEDNSTELTNLLSAGIWDEDSFDFNVPKVTQDNTVSPDKDTVVHLMRLASRFRQADARTGYDLAYKNLQDEIYAAIGCARKGIEFKPSVEL